jgi:hypothetical protein
MGMAKSDPSQESREPYWKPGESGQRMIPAAASAPSRTGISQQRPNAFDLLLQLPQWN